MFLLFWPTLYLRDLSFHPVKLSQQTKMLLRVPMQGDCAKVYHIFTVARENPGNTVFPMQFSLSRY